MRLQDLAHVIPGFASHKHVEKIKVFGWFVLVEEGRAHFTSADIKRCYAALEMAPPSSISAFLNNLARRTPALLLKRRDGYVLEHRVKAVLDSKLGHRPTAVQIDKLLADLPGRVSDEAERTFLAEAYTCFRYSAFRAAIVMTWNLAFDHLCRFVVRERLSEFNSQLKKAFPKERPIGQRSDLADLKERAILEVCRGANIITGNIHKILCEKLERRNIAAHPSAEVISQLTAEDFIKDLVENVVLCISVRGNAAPAPTQSAAMASVGGKD